MATWAISKEETNFARLTVTLPKVCTELLREALLQHIPNRNIQAAICANKKRLKTLLNVEQRQLLFPWHPATFTGSVADFDISLLYLLLRNISTVPAHGKGWGKIPDDQPRDCSIIANVERIRILRNKISRHTVDGKVLDTDFESFWTEIEDCVQDMETNLNVRSYLQALTKLKIQDLDPAYAARCIDKFEERLSDIQADRLKHLTDIKQDIDQLQSHQADQLKRLTDIKQDTGQLQSHQADQLKHLTDIKQDTGQLQSHQADQLKHLTDIKHDTGQLQRHQVDQLKRQDEQLKHLEDIKHNIAAVTDPSASRTIPGDHINYARLCNVLMTVCADALRKILSLKFQIPFTDIYSAIASNETKLTGGRKPLLNSDQKKLLFPVPPATSSATVDDFDISLLYLLIRNISIVSPPPSAKWGVKPSQKPRDVSLGASIERIRLLRNHIAGHSIKAEITDADFESHWNELTSCMGDIETEIGKFGFETAMESLKDENMNFLSVKQIGMKFHQELMANMQEIKNEVADGNAFRRVEYAELKMMFTEFKSSMIEELKLLSTQKVNHNIATTQ